MTPKHSAKVQTFASALKSARDATSPRLTQVQLAHELGVDPMTVSRWERGEAEPNRWLWPKVVDRFPELARFAPASVDRPSGTGTDG